MAAAPITAQQHAVYELRRRIVSSELKPGARIPQEDLASTLGISVAPVREALRVLEQEGQVSYFPRRGYFVTELRIEDLVEIYGLRAMLEAQAARRALPMLDEGALDRILQAARDCADAAELGDVAAELAANRRFHMTVLDGPDHPHTMRLIRLLWDSTEAYRAIYYNSPVERLRSLDAHDKIIAAIRSRNADELIAQLDLHRDRALQVLGSILNGSDR